MQLTEVQRWLSDEEIARIYTAAYWNDVDAEKSKEWWIEDRDYARCLGYLHDSRLMQEYRQAEEFIREIPGDKLRVGDLAAGIGWTSALLSKLDEVAEVHAVDISVHRIERLFPHCVSMLDGAGGKIRRYLGSFYDLKLPDGYLDVVFLSQAFHHAERPLQLMMECDRVLKPSGRLIMVGEHNIRALQMIRRFFKVLLQQRKIVANFRGLYPPDPVLGDHYYRHTDYHFLFDAMGYDLRHRVASTGQTIYVADKGAQLTVSRSPRPGRSH
jgi:ubiquinone/menaquinone biosynthesis C-methylase UbiE